MDEWMRDDAHLVLLFKGEVKVLKIDYIIKNNEVEIVRCYGTSGEVVLPEEVDGLKVVSVAPYCFSDRKRKEDTDVLTATVNEYGLGFGEGELLAGNIVESVSFPDSVERIGNYIFYGCKSLTKLKFSDRLKDIGSGAFTGCGSISKLYVRIVHDNKTAVKEILGDLWQRIDVRFENVITGNVSDLVFPEHYEEAVENTPARILYTQHHGSGNDYRQCFYNRELDYFKYDSLFIVAMARDDIDQLEDQVFKRLSTPVNMTDKHKEEYIMFIKTNYEKIIPDIIEKDNTDWINLFKEFKLWTDDMLDLAVDTASRLGRTEILSIIMNEKSKKSPAKKKKYLL